MKVAITGASGHIGSCLVRELIQEKVQVRVLVHRSGKSLEGLPVETIQGDLLNPQILYKLCRDIDVVFHLAAQIAIDKKSAQNARQVNTEGTRNLAETCLKLKVPRLIHFSSIHALNVHPLERVMDENRDLVIHSKQVYESSKAEGERIILSAAEKGLHAVILSPTAVLGPYDYHHSYLGQALIRIYRNKLPVLVPGGYNWVDVRDVARAAISSVEKGRKGERYILGGHWNSLQELSKLISQISDQKTPRIIAPLFIARIGLPFIRLFSIINNEHPLYTKDSLNILKESHQNISSGKAVNELDFHPRPLIETLRDTFEWYKQQGLML